MRLLWGRSDSLEWMEWGAERRYLLAPESGAWLRMEEPRMGDGTSALGALGPPAVGRLGFCELEHRYLLAPTSEAWLHSEEPRKGGEASAPWALGPSAVGSLDFGG